MVSISTRLRNLSSNLSMLKFHPYKRTIRSLNRHLRKPEPHDHTSRTSGSMSSEHFVSPLSIARSGGTQNKAFSTVSHIVSGEAFPMRLLPIDFLEKQGDGNPARGEILALRSWGFEGSTAKSGMQIERITETRVTGTE